MGGNISPTGEGSFPLGLGRKGDQVANLVDSSLMGKRIERPLLSRGNTGSSLAKDLGVFFVGLPTPQTDRHLMARKKCFRVGLPTPQTDHHHMVREGKG